MPFLIVWLMFGFLGRWIASQKGRSKAEGTVLGCVFGPFGCLIEAVLPTIKAKGARGIKAARRTGSKTGLVEPGEMPDDWDAPKVEPDDGVDMGWLK